MIYFLSFCLLHCLCRAIHQQRLFNWLHRTAPGSVRVYKYYFRKRHKTKVVQYRNIANERFEITVSWEDGNSKTNQPQSK